MEDQLNEYSKPEILAPGWRKTLTGWIDTLLVSLSVLIVYMLNSYFIQTPKELPNYIPLTVLVFILYRFFTVYFLETTVGMFILGLKFLNGHEEKLTNRERLFASIFIFINGVRYYKK